MAAVISLAAGAILGIGTMSLIDGKKETDSSGQDLQMLYISAVEDAAFAKAEEIMPLVSLTKDDPLVTWSPVRFPTGNCGLIRS